MNAAARTISFLRTLTHDGLLTNEEVWGLGKFFNDHPDCTECWPGELLAPMLASAFDDAKISEEEMQSLGDTIASIEEEWAGKNADKRLHGDNAPTSLKIEPALMPLIDQQFEVPSPREYAVYQVSLRDHTCTCPEWVQRRVNPLRHPSRCCRHMAYAFTRSGKVFEPWFQALLDDCFAKGRGTQNGCEWKLAEYSARRPVLLARGAGGWCLVFAPGEEKYESFAYNSAQNRWSFGEAPANALFVEHAIREGFPVS